MGKKLSYHIVYGLFDPTTGEIRYVGQTGYKLHHRLSRHLYEAKKLNVCDRKCAWINSLVGMGLRPEIYELERIAEGESWEPVEDFFIRYFRAIGADLFNETFGGAGSIGRTLRAETKMKIGAANSVKRGPMKVKRSPEHCRKISEAKKGKQMPMEHRKRISEALLKMHRTKRSLINEPA
jgi:hypothetical protein